MEIKTENIAAGTATPLSAEKLPELLYQRLLRYRTSIAVLHSMVKSGILKNTDFPKCCSILAEKYGLSLCSIFR